MLGFRLAFYGDDFTGSADALQALCQGGVRTVLFTTPPTEAELEQFDNLEAIGIAGQSRSMTPDEMDEKLRPILQFLNELDTPLIHYKVCSTFDSAPDVGNIGHVINMGAEITGSSYVPLAVGVPELGRFVVFANHFAHFDDEVYRLDRHPVMRDHPITPMDESDLRKHLAEQTTKTVANVDVRTLAEPIDTIRSDIGALTDDAEIVLFDTLTRDHLEKVGEILWTEAQESATPLFTVGSSGVEYALSHHWKKTGESSRSPTFPAADTVEQLVVVSGSASPVTDDQIGWAVENDFTPIRLNTSKLVDPNAARSEVQRAVADAVATVNKGNSVVLFTARGPGDRAISRTREKARELELQENTGRVIGERQGEILREILLETDLERACVSGGDTCSYVTPELAIYALEMVVPTAPGSPLCLAHSRNSNFDGLEIALKGGQLGQTDYYGRIREGR
ncbi:four-carbon acid sugar kinase family protein [Salinigranum salinum]|uniref:four-carbon acid sugar kinase family protein n=1 Tax=Salinigranum salinum TaxID=1364937 RepID=UPI001260F2C1|nr:four-carbon acid sugar kinase family protein [Salinigranum salinum]